MKQGSGLRLGLIAASLLLPVISPGAIATAKEAPKSATFTWAGKTYQAPIPAGYCLPTSEQQIFADEDASGDSQNETLMHLARCGTWGKDYILIKTPRISTPLDMSRGDFITALSEVLEEGSALEEGKRVGAQDVSRSSDGQVSLASQDFGFVGSDDTCAYLAGTITSVRQSLAITTRAASCTTLVGGQGFTIYSYDNRPDGAGIDTLKKRSRDVARSMTVQ